jgi:LysM repeat protein
MTPNRSVDRARRFVDGTIKQLRLVGPTAREVARAVARLQRRAFEVPEDPESRADALARYELVTGDARRVYEETDSVGTMTAERVRRTAYSIVTDAHRTTVESYPALWPTEDPTVLHHQLYTVASGDTLGSVATHFHVDTARLARDNDIDPRYQFVPGQPLWIATSASGVR